MRVLGVELTGNDAVVALVEYSNGMFYLPECRARRVECRNPDSAGDLRYFQKSIAKLIEDYKVDQLVIRERMKKGKFAGGANGFKLEAVIQLIDNCEVLLMTGTTQKAIFKKYPMTIPFAETGLKKFQQGAFDIAYAQLSDPEGKAEQARQLEIEKRKQNREADAD
ncbi:DUF3010 family protein [Thiomicrorhabdus sp.]|uniref:DUF3010 family protein n=1 Tax=Thiomicrorhabdus sp. TaxID=2039724 RepID=UPI0029C93395|nr:DUF3010 family protein [Thiomicrorhabdus sp.]